MEVYLLITFLAFIVFAGWSVLKKTLCAIEGLSVYEKIFLSYGVGMGLVTLGMLLMSVLNMRLTLINILAPWVGFSFIALIMLKDRSQGERSRRISVEKPASKLTYFESFLIFGISFETAYAFFRAIIKPIESYDAIAIYAIKAKIVYVAGTLSSNIIDNVIKAFPHPDYPLNIPLAESFAYLFMGNINDQLVKAIFPLFFAGLLCLLYQSVKRLSRRSYALIFTFILATIPQINAYASNAYLDLVLAFYYFGSAIFLFKWLEDTKDIRSLALSALLVGLAGWTKNEGLLYCIVNSAVILLFCIIDRKTSLVSKIGSLAVYMSIIILISMPWVYVKVVHHISNDEIDMLNLNPTYLAKHAYRIGPVFYEFQKEFFGPKKWILLWPSALIAIALSYKRLLTGVRLYIAASIAFAIVGYMLFYIISYVDVRYFAGKTWSRFLLHFLPVVVYYIAHIMKEEIKT